MNIDKFVGVFSAMVLLALSGVLIAERIVHQCLIGGCAS
jgi:hypothetical protein